MTTTRMTIIAAALAFHAACSTVAESTTSSTGEQSDESSSSESSDTGSGSSSESSDTGNDESDADGGSSLDGWPLDIPDGMPAESETGDPSHGACCFCAVVSDDGTTESDEGESADTGSDGIIELWCYGWNDTEASCLAWLGDAIKTYYDPDCAEAWTDIHDDDIHCDAVCF